MDIDRGAQVEVIVDSHYAGDDTGPTLQQFVSQAAASSLSAFRNRMSHMLFSAVRLRGCARVASVSEDVRGRYIENENRQNLLCDSN
jgi:hypothetical protein